MNTNYGLIDPDTGAITFSPDPANFGLEGLPPGGVTFFGQGSDKLFGTINGTALLDFQNLVGTATGTFTITGGSGNFSGATGTFIFFENDILSPDPTAPIKSRAVLSGSFQAVPEPRPSATVIGIGALGVGFLLHSRRNSRKRAF